MNTIKAILKKPGCKPEIININNDLETLQSLVEGYIQILPYFLGSDLIVNEEGKILRLPFNFFLLDDMIVGNALFVNHDKEGEIIGLTEKQIAFIQSKFE